MPIYNKLVRDNIPEIIRSRGGTCSTYTVVGHQLCDVLEAKLKEEVEELISGNNKGEELVDIFEVIDALLLSYAISREEVLALQQQKREKRGGFEKGIILVEASDM